MFHNFFILFSSISPSTACCLFSLDTTCPNNYISFIDHMLLFICNAPTLRCKSQDFNTSHVTLYPVLDSGVLHQRNCFNTSHVTLYLRAEAPRTIRGMVSIHLMLLFIENGKWLHLPMESFQYISCYSLSPLPRMHTIRLESFNTSHVTLYLLLMDGALRNHFVSIHLMLLFIEVKDQFGLEASLFQYISCYSLSVCPEPGCNVVVGFNTSHVTLYLQSSLSCRPQTQRFNTSHVTLYPLPEYQPSYNKIRFNTSHVTLYRKGNCWIPLLYWCFNTSHVTLYHLDFIGATLCITVSIHLMLLFITNCSKYCCDCCRFNTSHVTLYHVQIEERPSVAVSIHLMLLFIEKTGEDKPVKQQFQYISCYSLSKACVFEVDKKGLFQYISCYSLSIVHSGQLFSQSRFNTSHVTLYRNPERRFLRKADVSIHLMLLFIENI